MHSFKRALTITFITLITLAFVAFAVANRDAVQVSLFPLPYAADMPKFLLLFVCFVVGALVGGTTVSLSLFKAKRIARAEKIRAAALHNELQLLRMEQADRNLPQLP